MGRSTGRPGRAGGLRRARCGGCVRGDERPGRRGRRVVRSHRLAADVRGSFGKEGVGMTGRYLLVETERLRPAARGAGRLVRPHRHEHAGGAPARLCPARGGNIPAARRAAV